MRLRFWLMGRLAAVSVGLVIMMAPTVAGASSQGFTVLRGSPQPGMLMSLTANSGVIEPATDQNAKSLVGVVTPVTETSLDQQDGQTNVRTDGAANALVSTLGGDIRVGDRITASPLAGIGAKTNTNAWIVGIAQGSLDADTKTAIKSTIADSGGAKHTVYVASIPVLVKVTYYSASSQAAAADTNAQVPAVLQRAADALAGKHVSTRALILSFLLLVIGIIAAGVLINSTIRGGFLAIARQPLAKFVILREVWRSFGLALLILLFALAAAALILRIF